MFQARNFTACDDHNGADIARQWRKLYIVISITLRIPTSAKSQCPPFPPSPLTSVDYTPLPSTPPSRSSSAKSYCAIDVDSDHLEENGVAGQECFKNRIAQIVKEKDLKSLRELGGVAGVCSRLGPPLPSEVGTIGNSNPQVLETKTSFLYLLWHSCQRNRRIIFWLLVSAGLSFATEMKQEGPQSGWHDGVAIVVAVIMLVAFPSVTILWRQRKMVKLLKNKKLEVTILRGEEPQKVAISDIVVGDRICLQKGDEVPADGLLISGTGFVVDEVLSPKIDSVRNPFLLSGSKVIEGEGRMLVTSVRDKTTQAERQSLITHDSEKKKLLESQIEKPISYIDYLALLISVVVSIVVLIRLLSKQDGENDGLPEMKGNLTVDSLIKILERIFFRPKGKISILTSILAVVAISMQHGMPVTVLISLKYQIDKLALNQDANFQDLSASATMGLVTVICIDASSELIGKEEVSRACMGEKDIGNDVRFEVNGVFLEELKQGIEAYILASELSLAPMSNSVVSWAETALDMNIESLDKRFTILKHGELNSPRKGTGILVEKVGNNDQVLHLHWNGAASTILDMCSHCYNSKGQRDAMENHRSKLDQLVNDMKDSGLRPIAFAYRQTGVQELEQNGLVLLALIGLKYTCLEETKQALGKLKDAGIKIKLVSHNDIMEVRDIARDLGILEQVEDDSVLEGEGLRDLTDTTRLDKVNLAVVMGSFLPKDKLLMVQCLKTIGHVVAVFGGLTTSDNPVLQEVDVGIVESSRSTKMTKDNSGIHIKHFSALIQIVKGGRCIYQNIQKFTQLQLTACLSSLLVTLITAISTGESPLTAIQLIWVNVSMCFMGGPMMVMELNGEKQRANQPSYRKQSFITKEFCRDVVIQVLYQVSVSMILQFGDIVPDSTKQAQKTMIFNTFMLCQIFNILRTMSLFEKGVFRVVLQSYCFLVALGACLVIQVLLIQYAGGLAAGCMQLNAIQWAICILVSALSWGLHWPVKFLLDILMAYFDSISINTSSSFSSSPSWYFIPCLWFPFLMLIFFHVPPYHIDPIGKTL
ncbi:hypothetical protein L6164_031567 [Bauhinia variegata]|uniref:Uncharacterized protein n=1 Tax=Bauhinia variegata TaxID=167791 RepID=A0ACB9LFU0_BAUVA|nr:hypothetical protein L6164_031567 [Bauhinia variegata]